MVHGLTWPLLLRTDGRKFGKSEAGNVWLSSARTTPYAFFQYWMQVPDADVRRFLLQLTLLPLDEVEAVVEGHAQAPQHRTGQRRLAREVTTLVHGRVETDAAEAATGVLFGEELERVPEGAFVALEAEVPTSVVELERLVAGVDLVDLLVEAGVTDSRSAARRDLAQGSVYLNNDRVVGEEPRVTEADLRHGRWVLLRRGKRTYHLLRASSSSGGTTAPDR